MLEMVRDRSSANGGGRTDLGTDLEIDSRKMYMKKKEKGN
jgi:hypothetical protein